MLQSRIFYRLPPLNILELLQSLQPVTVQQGQAVINTGDIADCCYFIKEGRVKVCQQIDDEYLTVAYLAKGDFFGEEGLLKDAPRNADIDRLLKNPTLQAFSFALAQQQVDYQEAVWLDVRLAEEYQLAHLKGALHLALPDIRLKARQLPLNQQYMICCDNGQRSAAAAFLLGIQGYNASVLAGGLESLSSQQQMQYII